MKRKHFEALAQVMRVNDPARTGNNAAHTWADTVEDLIVELGRFNKSFNADRFRAACSEDKAS